MKILNSIKGLLLIFSFTKIFNPEDIFKGKRVAVIGPADSAYDKKNGSYIDSFDYVIRINKAAQSQTDKKAVYIGNKTDILFHSFFENNTSGGGSLDLDLFNKLKIKYLVNPRTNFESYRRTFNFFKKYKQNYTVFHLPKSFYNKMILPFGDLRPTIGFTALYSALNSECETLFISGFTFFKTPYAGGYRDHLVDMNKNIDHIRMQGIHDIELEYRLFKENLNFKKCKHLLFDDKLNEILAADHE